MQLRTSDLRRHDLLCLLPLALISACAGESSSGPELSPTPAGVASSSSGPIFEDLAREVGIDFTHFNGMSGEFYMAEMVGSGAAFFDYDGDGDQDLYLVQGCMLGEGKAVAEAAFAPVSPLSDRLYRNELVESGSLRFRDVTDESEIESTGYGMGVTAGDYDNDGDPDLYVTTLAANLMLRNDGDGTFTDVTEASATQDMRFSTSAVFTDYDRDGWLDLYVANYVDFSYATHKECYSETSARDYCGPLSFGSYPDRLFRNRGDGTFEDASVFAQIVLEHGGALGVIASDFNGDDWPDLYVANDGLANQLWINQRNGRFKNEALLAGCAFNADGRAEASMGVDAADFDGDGDEDLFMTHLTTETNTLYLNDGQGVFRDFTSTAGLARGSRAFTGFGTSWFDYDNDSWLDLICLNGAVQTIEALAAAGDPYPLHQTNQLFRNLGDLRFEETTDEGGPVFGHSEVSRGAAFGDVDNDGDTDVVVVNNSGPARLLVNRVGSATPWLGLRVIGADVGRDQYGARIACELDDGRTLWRRARADGGFCSSNDPRVLIGLGAGRTVRAVRVVWPAGEAEVWDWSSRAINAYVTLEEGSGAPVE